MCHIAKVAVVFQNTRGKHLNNNQILLFYLLLASLYDPDLQVEEKTPLLANTVLKINILQHEFLAF